MRIAIAKLSSLLHSKEKVQEAVAGIVLKKLQSETITLDSKAVQQAIRDRASGAELTSHKSEP